jgi:phosphate transport system protein
VAKAIERMGDHAENIAEVAIYIAEGEDVRYSAAVAQEMSRTENVDGE